MKRIIEITPEWVLREIPIEVNIDGDGKIGLATTIFSDLHWIILALNTLDIPHVEDYYLTADEYFFVAEFYIADIKDGCPSLYLEWMKDDEIAKRNRSIEKDISMTPSSGTDHKSSGVRPIGFIIPNTGKTIN